MAPITLQRFVKQLDKLKHELDAGTLRRHDYDGRLAGIMGALRDRRLDADRAAATAALAGAVTRGVITGREAVEVERRRRRSPPVPLARARWSSPLSKVGHSLPSPDKERGSKG